MNEKNIEVAVVCGGTSREAAVSRVSGKAVYDALQLSFDTVHILELDTLTAESLQRLNPDVVFPVLHGPPGEDGSLQGMLEILGFSYVGSGVLASACAMNKKVAKDVFRSVGLPVASDTVVNFSGLDLKKQADTLQRQFPNGFVIKPIDQGSAIGVSFCHQNENALGILHDCARNFQVAIVEELVIGREITAGILDAGQLVALPVTEIVVNDGSWYDFNHRYTEGASIHICPAQLPQQVYSEVQRIALAAHVGLGCRDLSRSDFVVTHSGRIVLLELNSLPGMTPTSLYPEQARIGGVSFELLVRKLVLSAHGRKSEKR
ncbi:D-alanine--D-alanine ligase [Xanthomonas translucens]|uniref:D-alanine--D-alanine ligase family protein n=1 Tax=Xanthomonas campestris pv. translucens TaxID=343 RepID=UPI00272D7AA5|nr:D-alanine--D-alanine ligase [Xanthomonas translucens]WLA12152.1 D-alanine--D-alanine ligase [Xanthomonas translucens]